MFISGIKTMFLGLSVIITQFAYPLIRDLYDVFMYFANFEFIHSDKIQEIWNNLYILVGVIVLFAIAIKLLSAMINPDTLGDSKKGVKGVYLRAVIAVVLIFLCPLGFTTLFDIQNDLLSNNFLMTRVFGYEISSNSSVGQMLAWETFSAFCTPVVNGEPVIGIPASSQGLKDYYATANDIDHITAMGDDLFIYPSLLDAAVSVNGVLLSGNPISGDIASVADGFVKVGFEYHSILCPLAGILVAYEMLLLCMDTIFRSAKLALLQLMLPIVLGAYVFNADILKKWAKEFFSTYLIVFFKVLAVGFMILAIQLLKGVIF